MSLGFLTPASRPGAPPAESPMTHLCEAAGASFELRDGWRVPVAFGDPRAEDRACERSVGWSDASHMTKLELHGAPGEIARLAGGLQTGTAVRSNGSWWCLVTPVRALVLAESGGADAVVGDAAASGGIGVVDVTTQFAGLRIAGPLAREAIARFCALDLRPHRAPVGAFMPGSVARTPGFVLHESPETYLTFVGAALAEYYWAQVADAAEALGGRPVGVDAMARASAPLEEVGRDA